jgi:hypothetical protein
VVSPSGDDFFLISLFLFAVRILPVYKRRRKKGGEQMKIKVNVRAGSKLRS